jgi:hypothetical protein
MNSITEVRLTTADVVVASTSAVAVAFVKAETKCAIEDFVDVAAVQVVVDVLIMPQRHCLHLHLHLLLVLHPLQICPGQIR